MKWWTRLLIAGALVAVAVFAVEMGRRNEATCCPGSVYVMPPELALPAAPQAAPKEQSLPRLVDLGAQGCIPCQKMAPILDELSAAYAAVFEVEFIDVWQPENRARAAEYGIESIPTQIFFDAEGRELWRHTGFLSKEEILEKWAELGVRVEMGAVGGS